MQLTKTDFIQYLNCPHSLWLLKNKPEVYEEYKAEFSLFLEKLIREGYEVEEYVMKMYPSQIDLEHMTDAEVSQHLQTPGFYSQAVMKHDNGLFARLDLVEVHEDQSITIYEIKSSTSIKTDKKHNHLKDICFQKYVAELSGYSVRNVYHVHLNKEFVKDGEIDPHELIVKEAVTDQVNEIYDPTIVEIQSALELINRAKINEELCSCLDKTRTNHCDTFTYFKKDIPPYSIYELNNIREKKIQDLRDMNVLKIADIPDDFKLSEYQQLQKQSVISDLPLIEDESIKQKLSELEFPLYFFDYETLPFAVPRVDRHNPHQHTPVQYSLHILQENGDIEHFEYLAETLEKPNKLIELMREQIGPTGMLISWYASFEKTRNKEMAEMFPEHAEFLHDINNRTFDLMDIFKKDYVDRNFYGSQSIKKVQPVLIPELSYKELDVQNGTMAVDAAERLYEMIDPQEISDLRTAMLKYCELDTLAMVEIYKRLREM